MRITSNLTALLALAIQTVASAASLSKQQLVELAQSVDESLVVQLVQRDCIDFEPTAEVILELSDKVPARVLSEAIHCKDAESAGFGASPPASSVPSPDPGSLSATAVVILPFSGTPEFRTLAAETLSTELLDLTDLQLIQPQSLETRRLVVASDPATASVSIAEVQRIGAAVSARYAIMGDINSTQGDGLLNAVATLKLVDVADGAVLQATQKKCGLLIANSQQQCVIRAVKRAAQDLAPGLNGRR